MTPTNPITEARFFIDHETIHDRVTGKHVVTNGTWPYEDTVEMVCDFLNSLVKPVPVTDTQAVMNLQAESQAAEIERLTRALSVTQEEGLTEIERLTAQVAVLEKNLDLACRIGESLSNELHGENE